MSERQSYFEFFAGTSIIYGFGALDQAGRQVARHGGRRAFIVADRVFVDNGAVDRLQKSIEAARISVAGIMTDIPVDSDLAFVHTGYDRAKTAKADFLIAIGGGSTIDTAKGMNILFGEDGRLPQGINVLKKRLPPMMAIPTTAGTGSEVTSAAVIKDNSQNLKISFTSPHICPTVALLDPELTLTLPAHLTASTGMDALGHAIESMHSNFNNPLADAYALRAIRLIIDNLPDAVADGNDLDARGSMLQASAMAGFAFSNTFVGVVHAMAHACGAVSNIPHGLSIAVLLPYGMEYNIGTSADRYALMAEAMGVARKSDNTETAAAVIKFLRTFSDGIGIPKSLSLAGAPKSDLDRIAETTMVDASIFTNPRPPEAKEIRVLLQKAFDGIEPLDQLPAEIASESPKSKPPSSTIGKIIGAGQTVGRAISEAVGSRIPEDRPGLTADELGVFALAFSKKLFGNPETAAKLASGQAIIQFVYYDERWGDREVSVTADCRREPIELFVDSAELEPTVVMRMHGDTAHRFWMRKVNLVAAVAKGEMSVDGPLAVVMKLLPAVRPGFELYRETMADLGFHKMLAYP